MIQLGKNEPSYDTKVTIPFGIAKLVSLIAIMHNESRVFSDMELEAHNKGDKLASELYGFFYEIARNKRDQYLKELNEKYGKEW